MPDRTVDTEILPLSQVATFLKVIERTVYRLVAARKNPVFTVGGIWQFSPPDKQKYIAEKSVAYNGRHTPSHKGAING